MTKRGKSVTQQGIDMILLLTIKIQYCKLKKKIFIPAKKKQKEIEKEMETMFELLKCLKTAMLQTFSNTKCKHFHHFLRSKTRVKP